MASNYIMVLQTVGQFCFTAIFLFGNRENDMQENGLLYSAYSVTNFIAIDKWKIF